MLMVMKKVILGLVAVVATSSAMAAKQSYLSVKDAALEQAAKWQATGKAKPIMGDDGIILFPYGQYMPKLTCSPLRACDIEMQPGEEVVDVVPGDPLQWKYKKGTSYENESTQITHVVVKPIDTGLETNLIIYTKRRTYHIKLVSPKVEGNYLNRVGFYYPGDLVQSWADKAETKIKEAENTVSELSVSPDKLDFNYDIDGPKSFKPLRVFNDGVRTLIQMPHDINYKESPVFVVKDENNNELVVNGRSREDYYIVDKVFDKGVLILGDQRVTIARKTNKGWW